MLCIPDKSLENKNILCHFRRIFFKPWRPVNRWKTSFTVLSRVSANLCINNSRAWHSRERLVWSLFLESLENLSDPKSQLSNWNPLVFKRWSFLCKKNQEDCEVWWLRTSALLRYKGNCGTRNRPEKFRDFLATLKPQAPDYSCSKVHWLNPYPLDKCFQINCVIQWIAVYPMGSTVHPLNNWARMFKGWIAFSTG